MHAVFLNSKVRDITLGFVLIPSWSTTASSETFLVILELAQSSLLGTILWHLSGRRRTIISRSSSPLSKEIAIRLRSSSRVCAISGIHLRCVTWEAFVMGLSDRARDDELKYYRQDY